MNKQQLAAKIWESANRMRSKIEPNEYKDYILGFIFYKYLSDKEEQWLLSQEYTKEDIINYVNEEDFETVRTVQKNLGYFISYKDLFSTWIHLGSDFSVDNVRTALSSFTRLISPSHKKVFEGIFNTLETGLSKLGENTKSQTKSVRDLAHLIDEIPMQKKQDYDVLGFIYEYLISNFAANAGKKAGEFYTPHEVSLLMSEIVANQLRGRENIKIYDPTSGSGSLLINIGQTTAKYMEDKNRIRYYAQELKSNTYNLTRMNLVMRGILPDNIVTRNGDTLEDDWPYFEDSDPVGRMIHSMWMLSFLIRPILNAGIRLEEKMIYAIPGTALRLSLKLIMHFYCMISITCGLMVLWQSSCLMGFCSVAVKKDKFVRTLLNRIILMRLSDFRRISFSVQGFQPLL